MKSVFGEKPAGGDDLRSLLADQARQASYEAVRSNGQIAAERVDSLERLSRLATICEAARKPPPRRWPVLAALGLTLSIASVLLFLRISATETELDITASEAGFTLRSGEPLLTTVELSGCSVAGIRRIHLPERTISANPGDDLSIRLSPSSIGSRAGSVTLETLRLPAGTDVWTSRGRVPNQLHLWTRLPSAARLETRVNVHGPVLIALPGQAPRIEAFEIPQAIVLESEARELDFVLSFKNVRDAFSPQLSVERLSFSRVEQSIEPGPASVRRVSTILGGTLYLESLNGQAVTLRAGEGLRFTSSAGVLRSLMLQEDHIAVKFTGTVRGMDTGSVDTRRSLMPTYLQWLRERQTLVLLWATALYVFSITAGILRWLGIHE